MAILDYFPNGWTPSKLQAEVLTELELRWNSAKVFVLKLDVASGKTPLMVCIAKWLASRSKKKSAGARILFPTNTLVSQSQRMFPDVATTQSPGHYYCETRQARCGGFAAKQRCRGCVYNRARNEARNAPVSFSTYHMSKALQQPREAVIVDECFLAGTPIATDTGTSTIGTIYRKWKAGDEISVQSFNTETGKFELNIVTHAWRRPTQKDLYRINLGGRTLTCTENHQILADNMEYIPAKELQPGQQVVARGAGKEGGLKVPQGDTFQVQKQYADYRVYEVKEVQNIGPTTRYVYDIEVANNHNFVVNFHAKSSNGVVVHNCHNLSSVIRDMHSKSLFAHRVSAPREIVDDPDLTHKWVLGLTDSDLQSYTEKERTILASFQKDLRSSQPLHFYNWSTDFWSNGGEAWGEKLYRSEPTELPVLVQQPLDIFTKPPPFWQDGQKLVLMSATVGRHDLYELGLDRTRPVFIEGDPPISTDRNPILKDYIGSISYANQTEMVPRLAEKITEYLDSKRGKGVIHITYGLANLVKPLLSHGRLITHGQGNMREQLKKFLSSDNGVFLVSGMYEGVSLDYDKADWQVISKIVWPSLQDPLQKYRSKDDPDYYLWSTLKNVIQASGRVCRRPDDYGETHIWDASFERLLTEGEHLIPQSFRRRIV